MSRQKKKPDDRLVRLALLTALISLIEKLKELVIKLLDYFGGR